MVSYKLDKYDKYFVAFILVILVIFNIGSCFAVEQETVDILTVSGLSISYGRNYFDTASGNVGYFQLEPGYIYHITNNSTQFGRNLAISSEVPALNGTYTYIQTLSAGDTYDYIVNANTNYFYFDFSIANDVSVTREKVADMSGAVGSLVDNVGPQQLWSVFESGIDFIGVVVLVAFGLFLIVLLIKKLSKGKSDF